MRHHITDRRGFTLLEVLIAVVVLAFGLLGMVAVFPAVIDVQRRAQDAVLGGSLAASAESLVNASVLDAQTLDWHDWEGESAPFVRRFPAREILTNSRTLSVVTLDEAAGIAEVDFLWDALPVDADGTITLGGTDAVVPFLFNDAALTVPTAGDDELPEIQFPVGQRLLPDEASGETPRYIWDAYVRRVDVGIGTAVDDDRSLVEVPLSRLRELPVEMLVVVRPIDRGIRVPVGLTLRDTLRGYRLVEQSDMLVRDNLEDEERRFPVAAFDVDGASVRPGAALDNNRVVYSLPVPVLPGRQTSQLFTSSGGTQLDLSRDISLPRVLAGAGVQASLPSVRRTLAQVGQQFVDDLGIVHRVTRVFESDSEDPESSTIIEITPPLSPDFRQIIFTPQVPADIRVIRTR